MFRPKNHPPTLRQPAIDHILTGGEAVLKLFSTTVLFVDPMLALLLPTDHFESSLLSYNASPTARSCLKYSTALSDTLSCSGNHLPGEAVKPRHFEAIWAMKEL